MPNYTLPVDYTKLTWQERRVVREQYVEEQKGLCQYCKSSLKLRPLGLMREYPIDVGLFPKDFLKWPVHLHNCHNTDMTIGAVHAYCNAVLWQYYGE